MTTNLMSITPSNDEVGERREQDTVHPHRGRRIKGAIISGYQVLDKRHLPSQVLQRGPEISPYVSLLLLEARHRTSSPYIHDLSLYPNNGT
jgi:hypothetical protein